MTYSSPEEAIVAHVDRVLRDWTAGNRLEEIRVRLLFMLDAINGLEVLEVGARPEEDDLRAAIADELEKHAATFRAPVVRGYVVHDNKPDEPPEPAV